MSITAMIKDHPRVGADYNEALGKAVKHAMQCSAICNSCADACAADLGDMMECIRKCSDASDICQALSRVAARRSGGNVLTLKSLLETSIVACQICAAECAHHNHAHCRRCEQMCRECIDDCGKALASLDEREAA